MAKDVMDSFDLTMDDFEDALLAQCAKQIEADYIVTRNTTDFVDSPVSAITPDDFLDLGFKCTLNGEFRVYRFINAFTTNSSKPHFEWFDFGGRD